MSKVYSFRLDEDNPREAQAKGVIDAWVKEGYSLRHLVVEALLSLNKQDAGQSELKEVVEQLQDLILSLDRSSAPKSSDTTLPNSFLDAVRLSAKSGLKGYRSATNNG